MGNSMTSIRRKSQNLRGRGWSRSPAQLMLPDGTVSEVGVLVDASEIMAQYPNHVVVHCWEERPDEVDERPKVKILQPDETLLPGQAYLIHPISAQQRLRTILNSQTPPLSRLKSQTLTASAVNVERTYDQKQGLKQGFGHKVFRSLQNYFSFRNADESVRITSGSMPLSESMYEDRQRQASMYMGWTPTLDSIPESPESLEIDSTPPSPLPIHVSEPDRPH